MRMIPASRLVATALIAVSAGCGGGGGGGTTPMAMTPSADTFINSGNPDNNNGASASLFVGVDDGGGVLRGLVRFDMPAAMAGATVSSVRFTLMTRALGAPALLRLNAFDESWTEGNGVGDAQMMFTVGQTCGAAVSGATWNRPSCADGAGPPWAAPGGSVAATASGQYDSNTVAVDVPVSWSSSEVGNAGLVADVQRWIDDPSSNHGWRISAADEVSAVTPQRFYSKEGDGTKGPKLMVTYDMPAR